MQKKCPICGIKTRRNGRKNGNGDKPRINIDLDGDDLILINP